MEEAGGHTFLSYVRGKVVDFSPENLRNVMRFRVQVQGATTDFETRKEHDQQLDQPQPEFEHHQEFNEPPVQPPPYHVPTYTDQHQKNLDSIETQLQNMMWYQQQALENMSKNQAEYMAELRDIKGKQQELYESNDKFYNQVRQE
ncbi:hypothetical protein PIB30_093684 [Stylosanthes scabra]|uniref:Uncharacterized protein n=1 Tax=Stylosanthes scabra TaxID=79078 RepID=A0ABU6UVZ1_9FABA|nr:hypothetical protein [Stylosanthes scabra]